MPWGNWPSSSTCWLRPAAGSRTGAGGWQQNPPSIRTRTAAQRPWVGLAPCLLPPADVWVGGPTTTLLLAGACLEEHLGRLMDSSVRSVAVRAAGAALRAIRSRGSLGQTCRLLFQLSKDQSLDAVFRKEQALGPVLESLSAFAADEDEAAAGQMPLEGAIYLSGVVKNVSLDQTNQRALAKLGVLAVMTSLLRRLVIEAQLPGSAAESWSQLGVQVSASLRNLGASSSFARQFAQAGTVPLLLQALSALPTQKELGLNITRVLSKLGADIGMPVSIRAAGRIQPVAARCSSRGGMQRPDRRLAGGPPVPRAPPAQGRAAAARPPLGLRSGHGHGHQSRLQGPLPSDAPGGRHLRRGAHPTCCRWFREGQRHRGCCQQGRPSGQARAGNGQPGH